MSGSLRLFTQTIDVAEGLPDWHRDYRSGLDFPVRPYPAYSIREDTGADIVAVWELSRLQFVPTLVEAHRRNGDSRYGDHFYCVIEHWQAANPYLYGVNWMCGLDVAIRACNIALGLVFFGDVGTHRHRAGVHLLWAHLEYLQRHDLYQQKSTVNNHQSVAAVLHMALLSLFDDPRATNWQRDAIAVVSREVERQFHPDGGNFESALHYHQFVLESLYVAYGFMADAEQAVDLNLGGRLPPEYGRCLIKATGFVADYVRTWQTMPMVGDCSDGRILLHRGYFDWQPDDASYLADWSALLLGQDDPFAAGEREATGAMVYADSGVGLFRSEQYSAVLCAMPVSMEAGGHNHMDKTSLLLRTPQTPLLVDSGTYCYTHDLASRAAFRSGRAHNVLFLAGRDQAQLPGVGAFEVPEFNRVGIMLDAETGSDRVFRMWHDGYSGHRGLGQVERDVVCHSKGVTVEDRVHGQGTVDAELIFNLQPGLTADLESNQFVVHGNDSALCTIRSPGPRWRLSIEAGAHSSGYGVREPSVRLVFAACLSLPLVARTEITIAGATT